MFQDLPSLDMPNAEEQNKLYHLAQDRMALLPNYYRWIHRRIRSHISGAVLEIGAGAGHILRYYLDHVDEVIAVDFNENLLEQLASAYSDPKVKTVRMDLLGNWCELDEIITPPI